MDIATIEKLITIYIYEDKRMKENSIDDIIRRLRRTFSDRGFMGTLANRKMNWMQINPSEAISKLLAFMATLEADSVLGGGE